jgi:hypothetical protein
MPAHQSIRLVPLGGAAPAPSGWHQIIARADGIYHVDALGVEVKLGGDGVAQYALQLDEDTVAGITYVGEAQPGTTTATGEWRIKRITESGVDVAIHWAGGEATFVNVWDDRLGLSYS